MAATMQHDIARTRRGPGNRALRKGRTSLSNHVYLVATVTHNRQPFFHDFRAGCVVARCFEDTRLLGDARMLAWVLMPDHVHWLMQLGTDDALDAVVKRLKSASAHSANRALQRSGPVWARAFHDHALRADEDLRRSARYVIANPLRAGLVTRVGDWPFWDAVWL